MYELLWQKQDYIYILGTCPKHCKFGQICISVDKGCPGCIEEYYGRHCQHRKYSCWVFFY